MAEYISFQPSDYFNTTLYTGTGSSNAITGVGFQPDTCWIKDRDASQPHVLFDAVRGANKRLYVDTTAAEGTETQALMSFDSDGFTLGTWGDLNNTDDFANWNWKMGTTTGISGAPTITPTGYSFNQTAGQSIIKYDGGGVSGDTVPHGLGVIPEMIIVKGLTSAYWWATYSKYIQGGTAADFYLKLNDTTARTNDLGYWNDTMPTSTVFSVGDDSNTNNSSDTYVAYCFASKKGYSKFGYYDGNGQSTQGTFVYTGFRPGLIIVKRTDSTGNWFMWDSSRLGRNPTNSYLMPSTNGAESASTNLDIFSNGFKCKTTDADMNANGATYIFAAWAEFPLVSSNDVPTVAR